MINKLKSNIPLTETDIAELERILWSEVGTKQDYERELGSMPLGEFVRGIVGMDMNAAFLKTRVMVRTMPFNPYDYQDPIAYSLPASSSSLPSLPQNRPSVRSNMPALPSSRRRQGR